jgi:hypothetical protein
MSFDIIGMIIMIALLILFLSIPILLIWSLVRNIRAKRLVWSTILGVLTLLVLGAYAPIFYANAPLGNKLVAKATAPDGTEMVLFQKCNYSAEPYLTHFYFRNPTGSWHSFQIDFEDTRWLSGRIECNTGIATVYRGKAEVAQFDWSNSTFRMGHYVETNGYVYPENTKDPWKK